VRACGSTAVERDDADDVLSETVERCRRIAPDVDLVAGVVEDHAVRALASRSADASLVVVGASATGPFAALLGSVGSALAGRVGVPVVIVRGEHGRDVGSDWPVLAAVRSAHEVDDVMQHACAPARRDGRPLAVVHALQPGPAAPMVLGVDRQWMDRRSWLSQAVRRWRNRSSSWPRCAEGSRT
jgi:nucleotide-binding universal stress UspA family protein